MAPTAYTVVVKIALGALVLAGLIAAPAYSDRVIGAGSSAVATLSPQTVGSTATLALKLHYEMQCGQPAPATVVVHLPTRMRTTSALAVRVGTTPIADATVSAGKVTFHFARHPGMTCMVIGPGSVVVRLIGVRNPSTPGTYTVRANVGTMSFSAPLAIRA